MEGDRSLMFWQCNQVQELLNAGNTYREERAGFYFTLAWSKTRESIPVFPFNQGFVDVSMLYAYDWLVLFDSDALGVLWSSLVGTLAP